MNTKIFKVVRYFTSRGLTGSELIKMRNNLAKEYELTDEELEQAVEEINKEWDTMNECYL